MGGGCEKGSDDGIVGPSRLERKDATVPIGTPGRIEEAITEPRLAKTRQASAVGGRVEPWVELV